MSSKVALITGGSGYFGEILCGLLLEKGYTCRILDLNEPGIAKSNKLSFHRADIRDLNAVERVAKDVDVIFHNVAQVPLAKDDKLFSSVNIDGTWNVAQAFRNSSARHLCYTSSSAVYGVPAQNPVTEETTPNPMESYGRAKLEGERICRNITGVGKSVSVIRPRTILGGGRLGIFQILFDWIASGYNVPVFDGGKNIYQFVHAEDLAKACVLASEKEENEDYNIGASEFGTMRELLTGLIESVGSESNVRSLPGSIVVPLMHLASKAGMSPLGPYHALMYGKSMYFDTNKAVKNLGWQSSYSNQNMILESYEQYVTGRSSSHEARSTSPHKSNVRQGILRFIGKNL